MPQIEVDFNIYQPISKIDRFRLSIIGIIDYCNNNLQEVIIIKINGKNFLIESNKDLTRQYTKIPTIENDTNKNTPTKLDELRLDYITQESSLRDVLFQDSLKLMLQKKEQKPEYFI